jgi:prepilin-type N-terminal cleavage/methylation domain-containing protein
MRGGTARDQGTCRGFSLIEVLLVLVLLVALGSLVLVSIGDRASAIKHDDAVGLIVQAATDARMEAMRSGQPVRLVATNRDTESRPRVRIAWIAYSQQDDEDFGGDVFTPDRTRAPMPPNAGLDDPAGWSDIGDPAGWSTPPGAGGIDGDDLQRLTDIADLPRGVSLVRRSLRPLVPADPAVDPAGTRDAMRSGLEGGGLVDRNRDGDQGAMPLGFDGPDAAGDPWNDPWNNAFDGSGGVPNGGVAAMGPQGSSQSGFGDVALGPTPADTITLGIFLPDGTAWGEAPVLVLTDGAFASRLTTSRATGSLLTESMRFADPSDPTDPTGTGPSGDASRDLMPSAPGLNGAAAALRSPWPRDGGG